ncbi:MAG: hypothetical protein EHM23_19640 [Acidobacteria bacterium]|nr:MAG: hypothetical protein EHM23_19640 [Acidobacteriota bacterium]
MPLAEGDNVGAKNNIMFFYYLFLAAFVVLMLYVFYQHVSSFRYEENEIRQLEHLELNVLSIMRLLEAPDVRVLLKNTTSRENLFLEFSAALKSDLGTLYKMGGVRLESMPLWAAFFASYYLMRLKAPLLCGQRDLHFLSGLELALVRSVRPR